MLGRFGSYLPTILILFVVFITLGDRLLPEPMKSASRNTRTSINEFLVNLSPQWNPKNPNERTEDAIKEQEDQIRKK